MANLGIEWAPMDVPLERRYQTLAAGFWIFAMLMGEFLGIGIILYCLYSDYYWLALGYIYWMCGDRNNCNQGGRTVHYMKNLSWWHKFRNYFPLKLIKKQDLDPEKNYLFCVFPHGVLCIGAFGNFATNATGFTKLFPGMTSHLLTLEGHFIVPLFRDFISSLGSCSSTPEGISYLLDKKKGKGRCAVLMVGGAAESLNNKPGIYKVILERRKGFVKLAMKAGAPLVPVFSFGEIELYNQFNNPEGSWLRTFQEKFKDITGIAPVIPLGRGIFQYSLGILPRRRPVTTVVGKPIEVQRNLDPTDEEVNAVHEQFVESLKRLFEEEKHNYIENASNTHLEIV